MCIDFAQSAQCVEVLHLWGHFLEFDSFFVSLALNLPEVRLGQAQMQHLMSRGAERLRRCDAPMLLRAGLEVLNTVVVAGHSSQGAQLVQVAPAGPRPVNETGFGHVASDSWLVVTTPFHFPVMIPGCVGHPHVAEAVQAVKTVMDPLL